MPDHKTKPEARLGRSKSANPPEDRQATGAGLRFEDIRRLVGKFQAEQSESDPDLDIPSDELLAPAGGANPPNPHDAFRALHKLLAPGSPTTITSLTGTVLEQRYRLGRVLGSGGMGAVFEALHLRLDRLVAIKVLQPKFATEVEYIKRFLREAKAASKIRHRNVVEILDYGETTGGLVYSVMEFLKGRDLEQVLREQPHDRIPWSKAYGLLVQIASGLKAAHGQGVIHRDIKPANCFLTDEDGDLVVKLLDFGLAKFESSSGGTLTNTAQLMGTPGYMAPELMQTRQPANPQSDIYALGVVTYRMLTGKLPFWGDTMFEVMRQTCYEPVPSPRAIVPDLPPPVENFMIQLLAKDPTERPADVKVLRDQLVQLGQDTLNHYAGLQSSALLHSAGNTSTPSGVAERAIPVVPQPMPLPVVPQPMVPKRNAAQPFATTMGAMPQTVSDRPRPAVGTLRSAPAPSAPAGPPSGQTVQVSEPLPLSGDTALSGENPMYSGETPVISGETLPFSDPAMLSHSGENVQYPDPALVSRSGETVPSIDAATLHSLRRTLAQSRAKRNRTALFIVLALVVLAGLGVVLLWGSTEDETAQPSPAPPPAAPSVRPTTEVPATPTPAPEEPVIEVDTAEVEPTSTDGVVEADPASSDAGDAADPAESTEPSELSPKKRKLKADDRPPADSVVLGRLEHKIARKCSGAATLKFLVTTSGTVMGLNATGPAASCARSQVQGTKFRPRSTSRPVKLVVK